MIDNANLYSAFLVFVIFLTYLAFKKYYRPPEISHCLPYIPNMSPENTIFAFDLHEVIMQPLRKEMVKKVLLTWEGWCLVFYFVRPSSVFLIWKMFRTKPYGFVSEELFLSLCQIHPSLSSLRPFYSDLVNSYHPDPYVVACLRALKRNSYRVVLFSNITRSLLTLMKEKHPNSFRSFDYYHVCCPEDEYIKKPNPDSFELFWRRVNEDDSFHIVFFDDCIKNVDQANRTKKKFHGVLFLNGEQLLKDLRDWKITE